MRSKSFTAGFKKFFENKDGKIVIWQKPNVFLIGWFLFLVLSKIISSKSFKADLNFVSFVFLAFWAILEIFKGDSYFRRALGLIVLAWSLLSHL
jgi:hypothetical protein